MKLLETYEIAEPVRVTYEFDGEFYFFDGHVTGEKSAYPVNAEKELVGYVYDWENGMTQNVYATDKVESLESLHTPKDA
jgi:hypothetical protein